MVESDVHGCNARRTDFICIGIVKRDVICPVSSLLVPQDICNMVKAKLVQSCGMSQLTRLVTDQGITELHVNGPTLSELRNRANHSV
jgi:hypothetical protein